MPYSFTYSGWDYDEPEGCGNEYEEPEGYGVEYDKNGVDSPCESEEETK